MTSEIVHETQDYLVKKVTRNEETKFQVQMKDSFVTRFESHRLESAIYTADKLFKGKS